MALRKEEPPGLTLTSGDETDDASNEVEGDTMSEPKKVICFSKSISIFSQSKEFTKSKVLYRLGGAKYVILKS